MTGWIFFNILGYIAYASKFEISSWLGHMFNVQTSKDKVTFNEC